MKIERFEDLIDWTRDTHRELSRCLRRMDLYRSLARRAEIEGARDLANELLALESHETMRLATQFNRVYEV